MHPLLRLPYAALGWSADGLARLPLRGEGKIARSLRARRDAVAKLVAWAETHRDRSRPLVWMHAPSVGEGLQARPVLERMRARHPEWQLLYTHFSPSAERLAASLNVDGHGYLPFDRAVHATRLFESLHPSALVFAKLDVWPVLTEAAAAHGIPVAVVSATMSVRSGRRGHVARALSRDAFASLSRVGAVDASDAERLVATGVRRDAISVTGDTRYDQVAARAASVRFDAAPLAALRSDRPTLVAGSTWPADERELLPAWRALRERVPDARLIIAPHEPTATHCAPIERWARDAGLSLAAIDVATAETDVVLVNKVGVLGDLYVLATAAFVGGGFHAAGLHSVLEPAAFGSPVLFGPRCDASRDAVLLQQCKGAESLRNTDELARALRILLTETDTRARAGRAARQLVDAGLGASDASVALVEALVRQPR
ncbi:MAG: hypothetical protein KF709_09355 [Gemmatimonadaceae bacterium]|nr:hypothetical protein [Gemmatimonadaceae bacterium]